ncbi:RYamide receptor-like [Panulirus ornatus]|uniref:RYamide receptor-like n=1 Tax=Panulirus ornatus TaxID=150431 RepID=UPI003A8AF029
MGRSGNTHRGGATSTGSVARVVSMLYHRAAVRAVLSPEIEEVLCLCDEDLHVQEARFFPPFMHCQMCNVSQLEMDLLFSTGLCISSHFSHIHWTFLMYMLIFVLALLGNSLLLYILVSKPSLRTGNNLFTASLAVGDLVNVALSVLFSVLSIIVLQDWPFGAGFCVFVNYFQGASASASALTFLVMSVRRYLDVIYPSRAHVTASQDKVILVLVWGGSLLIALPMAVFSSLDPPGKC